MIDLSHLVVTAITYKGLRLNAKAPIKFFPGIDQNKMYFIDDPAFDLFVMGETRKKLVEVFEKELVRTWKKFTTTKVALSQKGKNVRSCFLETFEPGLTFSEFQE